MTDHREPATKIPAMPFPFPIDGKFTAAAAALLVIDMQIDFCADGGFMARSGADMSCLRAPIAPIQRVLAASRAAGITVVYTREAFAPDLSNAQPHRLWRAEPGSIVVGDPGPAGRSLIAGEACTDVIPELAPLPSERIFDKPAYGAFHSTGIHDYLRGAGLRQLIMTGVTTDCCIQSNTREALDLGYETLVLEDCCGAGSRRLHDLSMGILKRESGVFGAVSRSADFLAFLRDLAGGK
jgi:nicotinamidase-related amidase